MAAVENRRQVLRDKVPGVCVAGVMKERWGMKLRGRKREHGLWIILMALLFNIRLYIDLEEGRECLAVTHESLFQEDYFREFTLFWMLSLLSLLQNDQGRRLTVCSELVWGYWASSVSVGRSLFVLLSDSVSQRVRCFKNQPTNSS